MPKPMTGQQAPSAIPMQKTGTDMQAEKGVPTKVLPLGKDKKVPIIFNAESSIGKLIDNIANRGRDYTDKKGNEVKFDEIYENYPEHLPNSKTGVILYYVLKGIKEEMGIGFDDVPYALRKRGKDSSSISTGERFSKEKKNDILSRCNASYYDPAMDLDDIFAKIKEAMEEKKYWEGEGYVLIPEKTKPPMKKNSMKYMEYLAAKEKNKAEAQERGVALGSMAKERAPGAGAGGAGRALETEGRH